MGDRQNGCWGSFIDGAAYRGDAFSIAVDVWETSVSDLEFRQTGYVVSIVSPISTPAVLRSSAGSRSISIPAGVRKHPAGIEVVSREHAELSLVPAVFAVEGRIEGEELAGMSEDVLVGNSKMAGMTHRFWCARRGKPRFSPKRWPKKRAIRTTISW